MESRDKQQSSAPQELHQVQSLLKELQQANQQLKQEKAHKKELKRQHLKELETLVAERTKELQISNSNLRIQMVERRKAEQQLYFEAHHDALTKLPNRAMFSDRLSYAVQQLKHKPNQRFAVLFIDLDRFKLINDTLGHHAGDLFLIEIADRLRACVRDNDVLARLGGDEFVILLDSLKLDDAEEVAERIINAIEKPYTIESNTLYSNASIGIAICSREYKSANEILRDADAAMYQAKSLGRGRYVFFDESMHEKLIATMALEQELRTAIKLQQFELHYQEISNLDNSTTIGFEALLRWQHPEKGLLAPSEFLFLAEETGIILLIESWVVEEVSRQLYAWRHDNQHQHSFIAINISGRHLAQVNQLDSLITLIKAQDFEPQKLILEFNEAAFYQHNELALQGLRKLKDLGVRLALDDYASGISSFSFLHSYPFEFIKLDREFIRTLKHNNKNLSLVKALLDLGEQFGYRLVAEGIESEDVMNKLQSVGCDFGQGYHISKPQEIVREAIYNIIKSYA
ncbi:MAG: EAL domain-containing protein [Colwellia sp.]|nr:EAL domain-containing protein [Colwellia sp.]